MSDYKAQNITVLEVLKQLEKDRGMYIGTTSEESCIILFGEVVDNSVDEALAGHCDRIEVNILPDNIIEVVDNGRGILLTSIPKYNKSALEIVLTVLHAEENLKMITILYRVDYVELEFQL